MPQRSRFHAIIFAAVFALALVAAGYFAGQSQPGRSSPPANLLAADKSYGVTIDLTQYTDEALAETLAALRRNGLLWLRQPILWHNLEPAPGQFNWDPLDRILAAIARHNRDAAGDSAQPFKLVAVLHTSPQWARPPHAPATAPPLNPSNFGRFARAVAHRYGPQLDHYQIWHEPNLSANWGQAYVDPPAYANLLREAALNIRTTDPGALILSAALAPTLENGPLNLNEIDYLDQLYRARANRWFDIVAGQPYGFDFEPSHPARPGRLNFKRLELLRRVMVQHGDAGTPIWATAFGWNALPLDWNGRPPPWRSDPERLDPPAVQRRRTAEGLALARHAWPWLGPIFGVRWDSTGLDSDDPARGFALAETPLLEPFRRVALARPVATVGDYPATHPSGRYSPGWRTALTRADIPRHPPRTLTIPFNGTRLDLRLTPGPYRGYLWVTIDDGPANTLPQTGQGRSYVVLYDPLRQPATVTLAQNLPPGPHTAVIEAEGGWGQWAISGWTVSNEGHHPAAPAGLALAGLLAGLSGLGLGWQLWPQLSAAVWRVVSWVNSYSPPADSAQMAIIFTGAIAFYLAPQPLALALLLPLILAILYRPDLGLALLAFSLSFFQTPKQLPLGPLLLTEIILLPTAAGFVLRPLLASLSNPQSPISNPQSLLSNPKPKTQNPKSLDWATLSFLLLGYLSTLAAPNFGVSMFAWRTVVLGPVVVYFLVRLGCDYGPPPAQRDSGPARRWAWRLLDALMAGAVVHSMLVLYRYFWVDQGVAVEGVRRALSPFYESPNNLALFLGRVWPILLAVTLLRRQPSPRPNRRRWLYGLGLLVVSVTLYLTFSRGALLLGLPASVMAMTLFYFGRRQGVRWRKMIGVTAASLGLALLALLPLSQTERFRTILAVSEGSTGFFRLKVWQAALRMVADHWPLGVGLDNFLYQYRTRYMLPEAWQEPNLSHPHNLVLDYATRLGVGGVALLIWLQWAFWSAAWRLYQKRPGPLVLGLMGSMVVFLSHGLVDHAYFLVDLAFIFFLTAGIVQRLAGVRPKM